MTPLCHRVAILGGGFSGLLSALRLLQQGKHVTIFEASGELGGLGATFEHRGHALEQFFHVIQNSDKNLLALLKELDLDGCIVWNQPKMGFLLGRKLLPLNTPFDVLNFGGLTLWGRIRKAIGTAYITRFCNDPKGLDGISASDWLEQQFGAEVYNSLWKPLLRARFGDLFEEVPALWMWQELRRTEGRARELTGCVRGGYRLIVQRLEKQILRLGGDIRLASPVVEIEDSPWSVRLKVNRRWEAFDAAISTVPLPLLGDIARGSLATMLPGKNIAYQGAVNAVVLLKRRLQPHLWNAIIKPDYPFQCMAEATHVVPISQTGGSHLVYLLNYCGTGSNAYNQTDGEIRFQALKVLRDFNPKFQPDWVEDITVFRAPFAQPVWPLGYQKEKPRMRVGDSRVYLATTAQCYPNLNSWNTMVGIASDAAARVKFDLDNIYDARLQPAPARARVHQKTA